MDIKDRLVLTGVRVTNFLIYWNFFAIFFTQTTNKNIETVHVKLNIINLSPPPPPQKSVVVT